MKPISWYKSLTHPKPRREHSLFLIEGRRAVDQVLTFHRPAVREILCTDDTAASYESSPSNVSVDVPIRVISTANMKSISSTAAPQGVAALVQIPCGVYTSKVPSESTKSTGGGRILLLEHIQDPGNVGALIRTAAAFGLGGVIMSEQCADPFSPKVVQSTAGSVLSLWLRRSVDYLAMADGLIADGYKLIGGDLDGSESQRVNNIGPCILALGNEGAGLSCELIDRCDYRIRIPIVASGAESLNVAASGAVLMYMIAHSSSPTGK